MKADRVIGVDLGGTKILAGVIDAGGRVHETVERPTVTTSQAALLDELALGRPVAAARGRSVRSASGFPRASTGAPGSRSAR